MRSSRCVVIAVWIWAACGTPAAPPRAPEHDLDEPVRRLDAAVAAAAPDAAAGSAASAPGSTPALDAAERVLAALARDIGAAMKSLSTDPTPELDAHCRDLDGKLGELRPRVAAAASAAALVRQDAARGKHLADELPIVGLAAMIGACRVRYQVQLPGMEGLIDDLQALVPGD